MCTSEIEFLDFYLRYLFPANQLLPNFDFPTHKLLQNKELEFAKVVDAAAEIIVILNPEQHKMLHYHLQDFEVTVINILPQIFSSLNQLIVPIAISVFFGSSEISNIYQTEIETARTNYHRDRIDWELLVPVGSMHPRYRKI